MEFKKDDSCSIQKSSFKLAYFFLTVLDKGYILLYILSFIIGLFLGAYDGFFGPGTGTFLVICFTGILGFNLITASGNAKIVNLASNFSALIAYILGRKVMFSIGVPAAVCAIAGNYLGAHLAIKNGDKIIKPIIFVAIGLLFIKVIFDLI